uniref:Late embryogenesis abundant protein LEA-2 subgroup domain-containing protein n=1 Tax=Ananas comosus var. bracteatus TaxID=296719 RepID=A0A6V7QWT9_ANACO
MAERSHPPLLRPGPTPPPSSPPPLAPSPSPPSSNRIPKPTRIRTRIPQQPQRRRCPCLSFLKWLLIAALALAVTFAISAIVFFAVVHPSAPKFTVDRVFVENPKKPAYDVAMHAANPSARMGIVYERGGKATLSHRGVNVAGGTTPGFQQGHRTRHGSGSCYRAHMRRHRRRLSGDERGVTCDVKVHGLVKDVRIASQTCKTNFRT